MAALTPIAERSVIVECHPNLVDERCLAFAEAIAPARVAALEERNATQRPVAPITCSCAEQRGHR